jgi:hypothetical protein
VNPAIIFLSPPLKIAALMTGMNHKMLPISEKLNIISKVDGTSNAPCTKMAEELGSPVNLMNLKWMV